MLWGTVICVCVKFFLKVWKSRRPKIATAILNKNKIEECTMPDIQGKASVMKTVWYWQ